MYARVYDREQNRYYKSIVYAILGENHFEQYAIVHDPDNNCFALVDYFDKEANMIRPLVVIINGDESDWVCRENAFRLKLKKYSRELGYGEFSWQNFYGRGYADVFENFPFLLALLRDKKVPADNAGIQRRGNHDEGEWNYIRTQADADDFMRQFVYFHDAVLEKMEYTESHYNTLTARFNNSGWYGIAELCFEGVLVCNLRPPTGNLCREFIGATLLVKDECILWADEELSEEEFAEVKNGHLNDCGSYIKALNLKWRKVG